MIYTALGEGSGTAVVIADGYGITAGHVARGADRMEVVAAEGNRPVEIIDVSPALDLALIAFDTEGYDPLPVAPFTEVNDKVWAGGFPAYADGKELYVAGTVAVSTPAGIKTTAAVWPGMSGGALIRCDKDKPVLSGILTAYDIELWSEDSEHGFAGEIVVVRNYLNSGISESTSSSAVQSFIQVAIATRERSLK